MIRTNTVETAKDRVGLAHDAGLPRISFLSVLAGAFAAYGAFALLASIFGAIAAAAGGSFEVPRGNWETAGIVSAVVLGLTLLLSYLFGGYVAGRMARRSGTSHGLMVFILGFLMAAVVSAFVTLTAGTDTVRSSVTDTLGSIGAPTSGSALQTIGSIGGVVALASMLLGSLVGGRLGDRWHGKLLTRALDPNVGPTAADLDDRHDVRDEDDREIDLRDRTLANEETQDIDRDEYVKATIGPLYNDETQRTRRSFDRPMNESQRVAVEGNRNREIERFNPNRPF
jgi:hypothetical protein